MRRRFGNSSAAASPAARGRGRLDFSLFAPLLSLFSGAAAAAWTLWHISLHQGSPCSALGDAIPGNQRNLPRKPPPPAPPTDRQAHLTDIHSSALCCRLMTANRRPAGSRAAVMYRLSSRRAVLRAARVIYCRLRREIGSRQTGGNVLLRRAASGGRLSVSRGRHSAARGGSSESLKSGSLSVQRLTAIKVKASFTP